MTTAIRLKLTHDEWMAEAEKRCPGPLRNLKFSCPSCGYAQSGQDFMNLGFSAEEASTRCAFSCIGRWMPAGSTVQEAFTEGSGPCNYAGGGLIGINPICVVIEGREQFFFDFADSPLVAG